MKKYEFPPEISDEIREQMRLLQSKDPQTCLTAMQTLRELKTDSVTDWFLGVYERDKRNFPKIWAGMVCLSLVIGTLACIGSSALTGQIVWGGWVGMIPPVIFLRLLLKQGRNNITLGLAALEDVRSVGPLTDALEFGDNKTRTLAKQALTRLLPRLQASDAPRLNTAQRHALHRILIGMDTLQTRPQFGFKQAPVEIRIEGMKRELGITDWNPDADLRVAILKALEQVGDANSLPYVQDVAAGATKTSEDVRVRRAAQECLPFLQTRAVLQDAQITLLRPTDTQERQPETLLRPAIGIGEPDAQQLLRPTTNETR